MHLLGGFSTEPSNLAYCRTISIHGTLINIKTSSKAVIDNLENECGYFRVPYTEEADFAVYAAETPECGSIINVDSKNRVFSYNIDSCSSLKVDINKKEAFLWSSHSSTLPFFLWQVFESLIIALLREKGLPCMHAASIEKHNRGILFPAMICSGKTTLLIELVRSGYRFLGDDLVFIDDNLEALCFPARICVTEYTRNRFSDIIPEGKLVTVPYSVKKCLRLDDIFPGSIADKCIPEYILFPSPGKKTRLKKISKSEALVRLIPSMYNDNKLLSKYHKETGFNKSIIFERAADLIEATEQFELTTGEKGLKEMISQLL